MKHLRLISIALSGVSLAVSGGFAAGCAGDTHGTAPFDASTDSPGDDGNGGGDTTIDTNADTAADMNVDSAPDVGNDTVTIDTGDAQDASQGDGDATADGAADSASDVVDGGSDALDAADGFDGFDGFAIPTSQITFAVDQAKAFCERQLQCCGADGGPYDYQACENVFEYGWERSASPFSTGGPNPGQAGVYNGTRINFDVDAAAGCIAAIRSIPCALQTPAQWAAVTDQCFSVSTGKTAIGQSGCLTSWECQSGAWCDTSADGGTCRALAGAGQPCANARFDEACSYLGSGNTGLYCDLLTASASATHGKCVPVLGDGGNCYSFDFSTYDDQACASKLCGDLNCNTTTTYPYPVFCGEYILDGGGGG